MKQYCFSASVQLSSAKVLAVIVCAISAYSSTAEAGDPEPYDFALSMSLDLGSVAMDRFENGLEAFSTELTRLDPDISTRGELGSKQLFAVTPRARFYLSRFAFVETGFEYLRNTGAVNLDIGDGEGSYTYTNFSVSIPVLFGVQLAEFHHMHFFGALGPSLLLLNRSNWDYDQGQTSDFASSRGGGVEFNIGGDYNIVSALSAHLALRYRFLRSNELALDGERFAPVPELGDLNYSGLSVVMGLRWHSY